MLRVVPWGIKGSRPRTHKRRDRLPNRRLFCRRNTNCDVRHMESRQSCECFILGSSFHPHFRRSLGVNSVPFLFKQLYHLVVVCR